MNLVLPIETANQILGYLGTRPYQEVFQLIQAIQDAAKPKEAPNVGEVDTKGD
jgi:hypothetical protein